MAKCRPQKGVPMTVQIRPFDPSMATERELVDHHEMSAAARALDMPEDPPLTYEAATGRLLSPPPTDGACIYWAAYLDGRLIGRVKAALPDGDNAGVAKVQVLVHPEQRRHGIGLALLRAAMPAILETKRGAIMGEAMKPDSAGARCADRLGFQITHSTVMQVLLVADVPADRWDVPVDPGYRLERWIGTTPEHLIDSCATARQAIRDAPTGQASFRDESTWTPESIREAERNLAAKGVEQRVVVAVDSATGLVAGLTGMLRYPHRREFGYQDNTSVLATHRGHGLGRAMKAAMMRWITRDWTGLDRIITASATENTYMIAVNRALGYYPARSMIWVETTPAQLAETLAALPDPRQGHC